MYSKCISYPKYSPEFNEQELDRQLSHSPRKRDTWAWVGAKPTGHTFFGQDVASDLRLASSSVLRHLHHLNALDLIARTEPPYPTSFPTPYEKLGDPNWEIVNRLLTNYGFEIVPVSPAAPPEAV